MMADQDVQSKVQSIMSCKSATENERILAEALLESFKRSRRNFHNMQWAVDQLNKLAKAVGVKLDPPPG